MDTHPPKAVLIDIDGTLLDSNDAHTQAWLTVLRQHGHDVPYDRIRSLIGKGGDKMLEEVVGFDDESDEGQQMADERRDLFLDRLLKDLKPTRGARALLERLRDDGLKLVIATSAGGTELKGLLQQAEVHDLIEEAATSSDAEDSKPDPDIILAALDKAGVDPADAVMLGDTPYDIESAAKAGVRTIVFRCGGRWKDEDFADAAAIYDDPAALLAAFDDSLLSRARIAA